MVNQWQDAEKHFMEEVGVVFEQTGLPRMAGRIFGCLLISDPPYQSFSQLMEALTASKGSISTSTRLLIETGLIERISLPGIRQGYFQIRTDASRNMIKRGLEDEIKMLRQMAERGLELLENKPSQACRNLEEIRDIYSFLERDFPRIPHCIKPGTNENEWREKNK